MIADFCSGLLRRLRRDERGNVLMLVGLSLVPMTTATGMAIDYSRAMRLQTELEAVTDAAALSALTLPMMKKNILDACATARHNFASQIGGLEGMILNASDPKQLSITITDSYPDAADATLTCGTSDSKSDSAKTDRSRSERVKSESVKSESVEAETKVALSAAAPLARKVEIAFNGRSKNLFGPLLGLTTLAVNGSARTETTLAPYVDIHLVLDTSQSMGLAATAEGEKLLWQATTAYSGDGCQFGCHVPTHAPLVPPETKAAAAPWKSNEQIANENGIDLRVDIERKAALDMISTARTNQGNQQLYRFGVYRIGREMTDAHTLTNDLQAVHDEVSKIRLGDNDTSGYGDTNLEAAGGVFQQMTSRILDHGNGVSAKEPRAYLFIVTDGVQDLCGQGHCVKVLDPAKCQSYKDNNITVGVIYTSYLPVKANPMNPSDSSLRGEYTWLISPLPPSSIAPALKACASEGWFFEAANAEGIHTAMQKLFNQASQTPAIVR